MVGNKRASFPNINQNVKTSCTGYANLPAWAHRICGKAVQFLLLSSTDVLVWVSAMDPGRSGCRSTDEVDCGGRGFAESAAQIGDDDDDEFFNKVTAPAFGARDTPRP